MRRRRMPPRGLFGSEAELCDVMSRVAREAGFAVHPECSGWDLLIVHRATGEQIGVQAKLRPNVGVLAQCLVGRGQPGPGIHAVLVPGLPDAFVTIAEHLNIEAFAAEGLQAVHLELVLKQKYRWQHSALAWAPDVEIVTPAGVPSPRSITKWKLSAVKFCLLLRRRGYVTPADMRTHGLHRAFWFLPRSPLLRSNGERGQYVFADPDSPSNPDMRWPEITQAITAAETTKPEPRIRTRVRRQG